MPCSSFIYCNFYFICFLSKVFRVIAGSYFCSICNSWRSITNSQLFLHGGGGGGAWATNKNMPPANAYGKARSKQISLKGPHSSLEHQISFNTLWSIQSYRRSTDTHTQKKRYEGQLSIRPPPPPCYPNGLAHYDHLVWWDGV